MSKAKPSFGGYRAFYAFSLVCIIPCLLAFLACSPGPRQRTSRREDLFSLGYGSGMGRLDFSKPESSDFDALVREGIFYIMDPANRKVLKLSSYGDILRMTPDAREGESGESAGLRAPEAFAVDAGQRLYIADRIADPRLAVYDQASETLCDRVIRRIGPGPEEEAPLGQEGPGGTPFPHIISLSILEDGSLAVVSASASRFLVHRFSPAGDLLSSARFSRGSLPLPESMKKTRGGSEEAGDELVHASLDSLFPRLLDGNFAILAKIDYYRESAAGSSAAGIGYEGSWIFTAEGESGRFKEALRVSREGEAEAPEFVGPSGRNFCFLEAPAEQGELSLSVLDPRGVVEARYSLLLPPGSGELAFLKPLGSGMIVGAALRDTDVAFFWWRLDDETSP